MVRVLVVCVFPLITGGWGPSISRRVDILFLPRAACEYSQLWGRPCGLLPTWDRSPLPPSAPPLKAPARSRSLALPHPCVFASLYSAQLTGTDEGPRLDPLLKGQGGRRREESRASSLTRGLRAARRDSLLEKGSEDVGGRSTVCRGGGCRGKCHAPAKVGMKFK